MTRRRGGVAAFVAAAVLLLLLAACGGEDGDGPARPTVLAAASLTDVLPRIAPDADHAFAGSDALAAQLREGAPADVLAAANERLPAELFAAGLIDRPRVFATNRLVLAVPREATGVEAVDDLARPGIVYVMAAEGVPLGDYTRDVLASLGRPELAEGAASYENDARDVLAKVSLGEADAGFVYATDATAAGDAVRAVPIPPSAQPPVRYAIATVADSKRRAEAEAYVARVLGPEGRRELEAAGFGLP